MRPMDERKCFGCQARDFFVSIARFVTVQGRLVTVQGRVPSDPAC